MTFLPKVRANAPDRFGALARIKWTRRAARPVTPTSRTSPGFPRRGAVRRTADLPTICEVLMKRTTYKSTARGKDRTLRYQEARRLKAAGIILPIGA